MATIKSFTDLSQSKKLAEILSLESADMCYEVGEDLDGYITKTLYTQLMHTPYDNNYIPCWSLAALLDIIPQELFGGEYIINITEGLDSKWIVSYNANNSASFYGLIANADNLVDACVDIIERLHERKML